MKKFFLAKKILPATAAIVLSIGILASTAMLQAFAGKIIVVDEIIYGDVNGDGKVNAIDASLVLQYDAKLISFSEDQIRVADVNRDGKVNAIDASLILQYDAKLISGF